MNSKISVKTDNSKYSHRFGVTHPEFPKYSICGVDVEVISATSRILKISVYALETTPLNSLLNPSMKHIDKIVLDFYSAEGKVIDTVEFNDCTWLTSSTKFEWHDDDVIKVNIDYLVGENI
jgi:hypothetical protein